MNRQMTKRTMDGLLAELYAKKERLAEEAHEAEMDIAAVERTLSIIESSGNEVEGKIFDESDDKVAAADIAHCKTQRAALYEIAKLNDGTVRATSAGDLIIAAGLSDGKRASVIATTHRFMSLSDEWEWTEPGTFRLKAFTPQEPKPAYRQPHQDFAAVMDVDDLPF